MGAGAALGLVGLAGAGAAAIAGGDLGAAAGAGDPAKGTATVGIPAGVLGRCSWFIWLGPGGVILRVTPFGLCGLGPGL